MLAPFLSDPDVTLYHGDALSVLRGLPDGSVHCCVTSPPYWGLRDYGTEGQLGLEATPDAYVEAMVAVFREVRRVLRADGTLWLNLGDSYAHGAPSGTAGQWNGSSPLGGNRNAEASTMGQQAQGSTAVAGLKPKDLCGVPWRLAFALQADGWYLRSDIIWAKPNPMPESVTDRPTKSHEYVFLLSKGPRYFFDQEAVREEASWERWGAQTVPKYNGTETTTGWIKERSREELSARTGRNVRSVWEIATQPYPEAHFATFPEELARRCILAGTSERGCCPECGAPWMRETSSGPDLNRPQAKRAMEIAEQHGLTEAHIEALQACGISDVGKALVTTHGTGKNGVAVQALADEARAVLKGYAREFLIRGRTETVGWRPSCRCGDWIPAGMPDAQPYRVPQPIPCTVIDPFGGSGTTALVARKHQRRTILVELSEPYCELASRRLAQQSLLAVEAS